MTSIYMHDPATADAALAELPPLPIGSLVAGAVNLLGEAAGLPQPQQITISDTQHISLQFAPAYPSLRAITGWAQHFGGVLASEPHEDEDGPQTWCRAEFGYYGVAVNAYAHIPATAVTT